MYRFQSLSDLPEITTPVILFRLPDEESETAMFNFGNATGEVEVTYINNQPNEWKAFTETVGSHVMQWVVFVLHVLVISLVTFRLYGFISDFGLQWSLPQFTFSFTQTISNHDLFSEQSCFAKFHFGKSSAQVISLLATHSRDDLALFYALLGYFASKYTRRHTHPHFEWDATGYGRMATTV